MPEAIFLSIRRRPADEAGLSVTVRGYADDGRHIVIPGPAVICRPRIAIGSALRLAGIAGEA